MLLWLLFVVFLKNGIFVISGCKNITNSFSLPINLLTNGMELLTITILNQRQLMTLIDVNHHV